jgi:hypothetical protein
LQVVRTRQQKADASLSLTAHRREKNTKGKWVMKRMHGQFPRSLDDMLVEREQIYRWLKFREIKGEQEA